MENVDEQIVDELFKKKGLRKLKTSIIFDNKILEKLKNSPEFELDFNNKDETNKTKNSNKKLSNKISSSYKSIFNYNQTELGSVKEKNTLETLKEFYKNLFYITNKVNKSSNDIEIIQNHLKNSKSLKNLSELYKYNSIEFLKKISQNIKCEMTLKNSLLIQYGDIANKFYIILRGKVAVLVPIEKKVLMTEREYQKYVENLKAIGEYELVFRFYADNIIVLENRINLSNNASRSSLIEINLLRDQVQGLLKAKACSITVDEYLSRIRLDYSTSNIVEKAQIKMEFSIYTYIHITTLVEGDKFGDIALHSDTNKRNASIIALEDCVFGVLDKKSYDNCIKETNEKLIRNNIQFILKRPVVEGVDKAYFIRKYYTYFVKIPIKKHEKIIIEGQPQDFLYFIRNGEYEITMRKSLIEIKKILEFIKGKSKDNDKELNDLQCII